MKFKNKRFIGIISGMLCTASFYAGALTLELPESKDFGEAAVLSEVNTFEQLLGWDFETEASKNEELWGIGEKASYSYENGMLVFELNNASETVEFVPSKVPCGINVNEENGRYLVIRLRNGGNGTKMQFWYQTEAMTGWDGNTRAFTVPIASKSENFITYTIDLSTWSGWGDSAYKTARINFPGSTNGRIEIEEIYFTDKRPEGSSDEYFCPMTNYFGVTPVSDIAITASRTDNWASIIKNNTDGSFSFTGETYLEDYSVWMKPSLSVDSSKIKYLVLRCSQDINLKDFVMLLADAENGRFDTWSVGSGHYEMKKSGNNSYIIFKLSSLGALQGKITNVQLYARVLTGTVYDAYWSSTGETADKLIDKKAVYILGDSIDVVQGTLPLQGIIRYFDGHEDEVSFEVSDTSVAEIVNENGKTYLRAKNNGTITVYAKSGDEILSEKEIIVTGQSDISPETIGFSARGDSIRGLRTNASVTAAVKKMSTDDVKIGFIATRQKILDDYLISDDEFTLKLPSEISYVKADSYVKKSGSVIVDKTLDNSNDTSLFVRLVLIDFPETKDAYTAVMAVRTYVQIGNAIFYGNVIKSSLYDVVKSFDENEIEANEYFSKVIEVCEKGENN